MKRWHKIALGAVVAIAAIISIVFWATSGITKTADEFLAASREGNHARAYELTARGLQQQFTQEELTRYLVANGLDDVVETSWSSRSISGNTGDLSGSVTTADGATLPLELGLVQEGGEWRIMRIVPPQIGLGLSGTTPTSAEFSVPADANPAHLLRFHTNLYISAMERGDFEYWSNFWVDEIGPDALEEAFYQSPEVAEMVQFFENLRPQITDARMIEENMLQVVGEYEAKGATLVVDMIFVRDGDDWKVGEAGIDLN